MLIKDPSGETVWNETEAIEPGEKFNRTYGSLDPFEDYTAVIVPVVDGKDQSPVEENFTTGNRRRYFVCFAANDSRQRRPVLLFQWARS